MGPGYVARAAVHVTVDTTSLLPCLVLTQNLSSWGYPGLVLDVLGVLGIFFQGYLHSGGNYHSVKRVRVSWPLIVSTGSRVDWQLSRDFERQISDKRAQFTEELSCHVL